MSFCDRQTVHKSVWSVPYANLSRAYHTRLSELHFDKRPVDELWSPALILQPQFVDHKWDLPATDMVGSLLCGAICYWMACGVIVMRLRKNPTFVLWLKLGYTFRHSCLIVWRTSLRMYYSALSSRPFLECNGRIAHIPIWIGWQQWKVGGEKVCRPEAPGRLGPNAVADHLEM